MGHTPGTCTYVHTMTAGSIFKIGNYIREYIGILYGFIGFTNKSSLKWPTTNREILLLKLIESP